MGMRHDHSVWMTLPLFSAAQRAGRRMDEARGEPPQPAPKPDEQSSNTSSSTLQGSLPTENIPKTTNSEPSPCLEHTLFCTHRTSWIFIGEVWGQVAVFSTLSASAGAASWQVAPPCRASSVAPHAPAGFRGHWRRGTCGKLIQPDTQSHSAGVRMDPDTLAFRQSFTWQGVFGNHLFCSFLLPCLFSPPEVSLVWWLPATHASQSPVYKPTHRAVRP